MRSLPGLPDLDETQRAHLERMHAVLRAEVEAGGGAIPFSRYMEMALHAPGLGYYRSGLKIFDAGGDFVTAPEISPLFASAVGRQVEQVLSTIGAREVVEIGAGSGAMAARMLADLAAGGGVRYRILEPSAASGTTTADRRGVRARRNPGLRMRWRPSSASSGSGFPSDMSRRSGRRGVPGLRASPSGWSAASCS